MRKYLHDYDRILERALKGLEEAEIPEMNRQLIKEFQRYNSLRDISPARMTKHISHLKRVSEIVKKDFDKVEVKDYESLVEELKREQKSIETIDSYKKVLKVFHKWMNGGELYPDCVKWFRGSGRKSKKLPDQMLVQEEVKDMIRHASNNRDKALISVLWESGARIGELGGLQMKNVSFDDFGAKIMVDGKTGMRKVRLVNSSPYLAKWINEHPLNKDPEAPVWINLLFNRNNQMRYDYIKKMLGEVGKRAKITKPLHPHNFRHSRATYVAQFLTEAQMKEYFGWTSGSDMPAQYIHLSGKQVDDAILKMNGLKKDDRKEDILQEKNCPRCGTKNEVNGEYCSRCWLPLSVKAQTEAEEIETKSSGFSAESLKLLKDIASNPSKLKGIISQMENSGGV